MKKSIVILNIILMIFLLSLPIAGIFMLRIFADWTNSLPNFVVWILFIAIIGVFIILMAFIIKSKHFGRVFQEAWNISQKSFNKSDKKNRSEVEQYQIDSHIYENKTKHYSQLNRIKGMIFIVPSSLLTLYVLIKSNELNILVIFLILFTLGLTYNYFGRIIVVSPEGIRSVSLFKNQFFKWEKVKTIGISVTGQGGKNNIDAFMLVYVSTKEIKTNQYIIAGDKKGVITFKFRAKIIHHIMAYYKEEIINLHNIKRWRRYLKKVQALSSEDK